MHYCSSNCSPLQIHSETFRFGKLAYWMKRLKSLTLTGFLIQIRKKLNLYLLKMDVCVQGGCIPAAPPSQSCWQTSVVSLQLIRAWMRSSREKLVTDWLVSLPLLRTIWAIVKLTRIISTLFSLEKAICRTSTFVAMAPDIPQSFL